MDSSRWVYTYDALGQVTGGKKYWSDGTPVAGQHFEYAFDTIGNRKTTASGGDNSGAGLRPASYSVNTLNQYTSREVPGYVNSLGTANNNATVSLWSDTGLYAPTSRKGEYFRGELPVNNSTGALWLTITNVAVLNDGGNPDIVTNTTGNVLLSKTPETFTYDFDGNLTSDGRWTNRWDAENRLIEMEALSSAPSAAKKKLAFTYDQQGRRIQKVVSSWNGSAYVAQSTNKFVYDGWNLIAELNHTNGIVRTYLWGLDLSGSQQGAGGVGGLLLINQSATTNAQLFCAYDGNGNLAALIGATNGTALANYEYGPFGEVIRVSGLSASSNPFRFSTKYQDDETGLLYYGYRYYDSGTGRWLSRDPIEEEGGFNLTSILQNDVLNAIDLLGLKWIVERKLEPRAVAYVDCAGADTFDDLAKKLLLDTTDYQKWARTSDQTPVPGKKYSIPNTIYVDVGDLKPGDPYPLNIIGYWLRRNVKDMAEWAKKGFRVSYDEGVLDHEITTHLANENTHGYVFIGHGWEGANINTWSHLGNDGGVGPDRYSHHGLAFMDLNACFSAHKVLNPSRYRYNAWESNVAKRGWLKGYKGDVDLRNELFMWTITRGKNDGGYKQP